MVCSKKEHIDLLIIGGGPAGYTAAIYASRAGLCPVLYEGPTPGGQLMITDRVENYPGYPVGVLGPTMMEEFKQQALRFGTDVRAGMVTSVDFSTYPLQVTVDEMHHITAKAVIIATGASAKWLGLPSEKKLNGKGVSACAICDGFFFRGKDVVVVGGGDSAAEEALFLSNICNKVYMLVRRDVMRASFIMQERVKKNAKIEILWCHETEEILGDKAVTGVRVRHNQTQKVKEIAIAGFFVAIGHTPNTAIFTPYLDHYPNGYLKTTPGSTHTSVSGVFAAGDVQDATYRQAVTAAATGCMAALDAERFLSAQA